MQQLNPTSLACTYCAKSQASLFFSLIYKQDSLQETVTKIMNSLTLMTPIERWSVVCNFQAEFRKQNINIEKVKALKAALAEQEKSLTWKDTVLGANQNKRADNHTFFLKYSNSMEIPILMENRLHVFPGDEIKVAFGSTFTTNKVNRIDTKGSFILDAAFGTICINQKNQFNGYAVAVADGAGGHFGDPFQDQVIGGTARSAVKSAVRLTAAYQQADDLVKEQNAIIQAIRKETLRKGKGESTTLACCRVFPDKLGFRIVGFIIGDNMVIAWDPSKKKVYNLLPSKCSEVGTALLPEGFRHFEIGIVDTIIPEGCLLYLMTDGLHDSLPYTEEEKSYPNNLGYKERTLDKIKSIFEEIPENSSQEVFLRAILRKAFETVEEQRKNHTALDSNIGDDLSVIQCKLVNRTL